MNILKNGADLLLSSSTWDTEFANISQYFNDSYVMFFNAYNDNTIYVSVMDTLNYGTSTRRTYKTSNTNQYSVCGYTTRFTLHTNYNSNHTLKFNTRSASNAETMTTTQFATTQTVYSNSNATQVLYPASNSQPYYSTNWFKFDGKYQDANFSYVYNPNLQNVTVQDLLAQDVQMKAISYIDIYYDNDYLCIAGDLEYLDHVYLAYYKYNRYNGQWEPYQFVSPYTNYEIEGNQIRLYFNGNFVANTIVCLGFIPKAESGFYSQYAWFYLTGKNTSTSSGIVVPSSYSGDNDVQQQINDNNLQEIKDTLTDDSQVDNILGEFVSGDASDIAEKFGFSILNRYYYDFIHDTIVDIVEVLEDDGDVYFDYSMHGESPTRIYASDFTTPNGPLKTFLSMFLISCTVFAFYKYIADLIELISTGNILEALQEFKVDRNIFKM